MKRIPLTQGQYAIVDDEDYDWLSQWKWYADRIDRKGKPPYFCAKRNLPRENQLRRSVKMHRLILEAPDGLVVDHINGNPLDNRRANLRLCSQKENTWNQSARRGTSKFKGVYRKGKVWSAEIYASGIRYYLGRFSSEKEAALAYDRKAMELHGKFCSTNLL